MRNLYSEARTREAIARLFNASLDLTGNLPPLPAISRTNSRPSSGFRGQPRRVQPQAEADQRDKLAASPGSANHMVSIGKALWRWAIPREFAATNLFREIELLEVEDDGHWPQPQWALDHVETQAWPDIARFVYLAVNLGQRESDVIRVGPDALDAGGVWVRPHKTRKARKAFWVPLLDEARQKLRAWMDAPLTFHVERRREPVVLATGKTFVFSPAGAPYTPEGIRSRWNRWPRTEPGKELRRLWDAWERKQRERDGEQVAVDPILRPTLHGLRSTAVIHRRMAGYADNQIPNDIGMSLPMVRRYSRFIDQRAAAENNIVLLEDRRRRRSGLESGGRGR